MQRHMHRPSETRVLHEPGEIILAAIGNFLEDPTSDRKPRPAIVLRNGECQHLVAGLTTQPIYKTSGGKRSEVPNPPACGLGKPGYLWSHRPTMLSRIDALKHLGWIDHETVKVIASTMKLTPAMFQDLWQAAERHHPRLCDALSV